MTCDAITGKCHCKCDVEGDKCDTCTDGHKGFPDCHGQWFSNIFVKKFKIFSINWNFSFLQNVIVTRMVLLLLFVTKLLVNVHAKLWLLVLLVISVMMDIMIFQILANVSNISKSISFETNKLFCPSM